MIAFNIWIVRQPSVWQIVTEIWIVSYFSQGSDSKFATVLVVQKNNLSYFWTHENSTVLNYLGLGSVSMWGFYKFSRPKWKEGFTTILKGFHYPEHVFIYISKISSHPDFIWSLYWCPLLEKETKVETPCFSFRRSRVLGNDFTTEFFSSANIYSYQWRHRLAMLTAVLYCYWLKGM